MSSAMSSASVAPPNGSPTHDHGRTHQQPRDPASEPPVAQVHAQDCATALRVIDALPRIPLFRDATPVDEASRLRARVGMRARLLIKRDDAIPFGAGGNKVRKLELVAGRAMADGADTLITCGGVQSNHCRVTAAVAARLGLDCVLVVNGAPPADASAATGNARLVRLFGAQVDYVADRDARAPRMQQVVEDLRARQRRPCAIPLGASTPLGALGYVRAIHELLQQIPAPDVIIHSTSSAGTQAGLVAGCALHGVRTRVIGVSADASADEATAAVREIIDGIAALLETAAPELRLDPTRLAHGVEVDANFVGAGYGIPTEASTEALTLAARCEGLLVDPVYGAKALASLIASARADAFAESQTVLFWHTGGVPGLFA
jgi:1-aminocyclopropane-1-carboxylate deaminase/D-cysteine desulfhydrase-like pyridoxal-dependent ACC family enzyme